MNRRITQRAGVVTGLLGVVAVALSSTGAGPAAALTLPDRTLVRRTVDGHTITATLTRQSVKLTTRMTSVGTTRQAWVSGSVRVDVAGANVKAGALRAGYLVGCQVNFGGGTASGTAEEDAAISDSETTTSTSTSGTASLSIGPGDTATFSPYATYNGNLDPDADNYASYWVKFTGNSGGSSWSQYPIYIDGCAGYAQAVEFVRVRIDTLQERAYIVLWSKPFSLG
ncbi:MAG: MspA family porin [Gordonia sp. (in: high G+C Gram-positive bacteria)]